MDDIGAMDVFSDRKPVKQSHSNFKEFTKCNQQSLSTIKKIKLPLSSTKYNYGKCVVA